MFGLGIIQLTEEAGALTRLFHAVLKTLLGLCANSEIAANAIFHYAPYLFNPVDLDVGEWN